MDEILAYERQHVRYWERFGLGRAGPDFSDRKVLDLGCGTGWRCLEIAARGSRRVVGIDPFAKSVRTAVETLKRRSALTEVVEYRIGTIHDLDEHDFDVVVSENAFEHILDVPEVLAGIRTVLRPGGRAYIGFGPLYHSPFGDHDWMRRALPGGQRFRIPWGHLLVRQRWLFRRMEKLYGKPVRSTTDWPFLALNQIPAGQFHRLFQDSGMRVLGSGGTPISVGKADCSAQSAASPFSVDTLRWGSTASLKNRTANVASVRGLGHTPPNTSSNRSVPKTDTSRRPLIRSDRGGKSLGTGTCLIFLMISGLIRMAINSHFGEQPRHASPAEKRQSEESARQIFESMGSRPTWQRALEKLNLFETLIQADPKDAEAYNGHARILATYSDKQFRKCAEWSLEHNGRHDHLSIARRAVVDATMACTLTHWTNGSYLDTLAAAYAEAGDFDSAVECQSKAIGLVAVKKKAEFQSRLALYKTHKPFREEPRD